MNKLIVSAALSIISILSTMVTATANANVGLLRGLGGGNSENAPKGPPTNQDDEEEAPSACESLPMNTVDGLYQGYDPAILGLGVCNATMSHLLDPIQGCLIGLQLSGFQLQDVDAYDQWYTNTSFTTVKQTGVYLGVDGIKEYITFGALQGQYMNVGVDTFADGHPLAGSEKRFPIALSADGSIAAGGGRCEIALSSIFLFDFDAPDKTFLESDESGEAIMLTKGGNMTSNVLGKYTYDYTFDGTSFGIQIESLKIVYPDDFWKTFAYKFNTSQFEDYLCTTMKDMCSDTWDMNGFENQNVDSAMNTCKNRVRDLPLVDSANGWNGKSLGCRMMHLSFVARGNGVHCNHISFRGLEDPNGKIKCQGDGNNEEVMTLQELGIFDFVGQNVFQVPDGFTCAGDCL